MQRIIVYIVLGALALLVLAFTPPFPAGTSQSNPVSLGTFVGTLPCADCPGIDTRLTLTQDTGNPPSGTYELSLTYRERDVDPFIQHGRWITVHGTPKDPNAIVYILDPDAPEHLSVYLRVDADTLRQLDREGNEIDAPFPLTLSRTK